MYSVNRTKGSSEGLSLSHVARVAQHSRLSIPRSVMVRKPSLLDLCRTTLYIGAIGYGGPAILALMKRTLVDRRKWISEREFNVESGGCCGGRHPFGFRRRFTTREEEAAALEDYLKELEAETKGVQERLAEMRP